MVITMVVARMITVLVMITMLMDMAGRVVIVCGQHAVVHGVPQT